MSVIVFYKMPFLRVLFANIVFFFKKLSVKRTYFMVPSDRHKLPTNAKQTEVNRENKHHHCYYALYSSCIKSVSCDEISSATSSIVLLSTSTNVV